MWFRPLSLLDVCLGKETADVAILDGNLINVCTGEIQEGVSVYIKGEWIAYVGKGGYERISSKTYVVDAKNKYILPGFIDAHTHLAGQYHSPTEVINYIIPTGTTTLVTEILELYMVSGLQGLKEIIDFFSSQPIKIFFLAPTNISISPEVSDIPIEDMEYFLHRKDVLGLGESYWQEVIRKGENFLSFLNNFFISGKTLEGHSAGAKDEKLMAYICCGISSCHEPIKFEEAIERLRLGIYVMIREGGVRKDLEQMRKLRDMDIDKRKLILVTDSMDPESLLEQGYLNKVVQKAIDLGFDPIEVFQMVTINPAQHFKIEDWIGSISPGKQADILIISDIREISPDYIISKGKVLVEDGKQVVGAHKMNFSKGVLNTIAVKGNFTDEEFKVHCPFSTTRIRVMEYVTELITREIFLDIEVKNGEISADTEKDLLKVCVVDRAGKHKFIGFVKGLGLKSGAVACSSCWDTTDIVVVGTNDNDMANALNRVIKLQGGFVFSVDEKSSEIPLPIYGLLPDLSLKETVKRLRYLRDTLKKMGFKFERPWLVLSILTCAAIPFFRICERGYVNFKEHGVKGLFVN